MKNKILRYDKMFSYTISLVYNFDDNNNNKIHILKTASEVIKILCIIFNMSF